MVPALPEGFDGYFAKRGDQCGGLAWWCISTVSPAVVHAQRTVAERGERPAPELRVAASRAITRLLDNILLMAYPKHFAELKQGVEHWNNTDWASSPAIARRR
jgi:hypothetical protein